MRQRKIRIRGANWVLKFVQKVLVASAEDLHGLTLPEKREFQVATKDRAQSHIKETAFHEILHGACPELSEETVVMIEENLLPVMRDNRSVFDWILCDD